MPQPRQMYQDAALTSVSVAYTNSEFIADIVAPSAEVTRDTGVYYVFDKSNLRPEDSQRTGMAGSNEIDYSMSTSTYGPLMEHSLKIGIPVKALEQYDQPLRPRTNATNVLTEKLMIEKELAVSTVLYSTTLTPQYATLSGTSQWSDYANSDPIANIQTGIDAILAAGLKMPNLGVMSWAVWSKLKNHPDLIDRIKYYNLGKVSLEALATLLDLDKVVVSKASYNTAKEGQTDSLGFVWAKMFSLLYTNPSNNLEDVTALRTLTLRGARAVYNWPATEPGIGEYVKVKDDYELKQIATEAAYSIRDAVA